VIIIDHGKLFFDGPLSSIVDRFSSHKVLHLTFSHEVQGQFDAMGEVLESTPLSLRLRVLRSKVADVCREALAAWPVIDLAVSEPSVEEVIRQLFDTVQK
jgi:ABC-2 type transport system ATP-binding protein